MTAEEERRESEWRSAKAGEENETMKAPYESEKPANVRLQSEISMCEMKMASAALAGVSGGIISKAALSAASKKYRGA